MRVFFQMLGMTGFILVFYGLLSGALTGIRGGFFWTLMGGGLALILTFVATTLSRAWQAALGALAALNAAWILGTMGGAWPVWVKVLVAALCLAGLAAASFGRTPLVRLWPAVAIMTASLIVLLAWPSAAWRGHAALVSALALNAVFLPLCWGFLKELFTSRSAQMGANTVLYTVVVVGIVAALSYFSTQKHRQWDFTQDRVNTLSDQSVRVLKGLGEPVRVTVFLKTGSQARSPAAQLLDRYEFQSGKFEGRVSDPDQDRELALKHNVQEGDIVVEYAGRFNVTREATEQGITQSIVKVSRETTPTLCATTGHGEVPIDDEEETRSLSAVAGALRNEGYEVRTLESLSPSVDPDCSVLAVAGPTQAFSKMEAEVIDTFLDGGGKALFLLDPILPDPRLATDWRVRETGLEELLARRGVDLGRDLILQRHMELFRGITTDARVITRTFGHHAITDPLSNVQLQFERVRSVRKKPGAPGIHAELVSSAGAGMSWAETNLSRLLLEQKAEPDGADIPGPVPIAMAVEGDDGDEQGSTKLVVVGDSDFATNGLVRGVETNFDFLLNSVNWLSGEVEHISIRPKRLRTSVVELSAEQSNRIFYIAIVLIPMLIFVFGINLWWWRRRRG